jgi:hypothetical protein
MTFDAAHLSSVFRDIETYLGYLKGNELAYTYLEDVTWYYFDNDKTAGPSTFLLNLDHYPAPYEFPCSDELYRVRPENRVTTFEISYDPHAVPSGTDPFEPLAKQIRDGADQAWHNGASWASGIGDYLYSLCAQFVRPDVPALAGGIQDLQGQVVQKLDLEARDDWANIGALLDGWHGDAAYAFKTFYANYNDTLAQLAALSAYVTAGFAAGTHVINSTQHGVIKYAESVRTALEDQLAYWRNGAPPKNPPETPGWVITMTEVSKDAYSLLDHVPVASTVKGYVDKAVSIGSSLKAIAEDVGIDVEPPHEDRPFEAHSADELYQAVTTTLDVDYYQAYDTAMNQLYSGGPVDPDQADQVPFSAQAVEGLLNDIKGRYDWGLPTVTDESLYEDGATY